MRRFARTGDEVFVAEGEHESGEEGGKNVSMDQSLKVQAQWRQWKPTKRCACALINFRQISAVQVFCYVNSKAVAQKATYETLRLCIDNSLCNSRVQVSRLSQKEMLREEE
eukprot:s3717_g6.t1